MSASHVIFTLRPNKTSLWLPVKLAAAMGIVKGQLLTDAQFNDARIQELLEKRLSRKGEEQVE